MKRLNDTLPDCKHCNLAQERVRVGEGEVGGKVWYLCKACRTMRGMFWEN